MIAVAGKQNRKSSHYKSDFKARCILCFVLFLLCLLVRFMPNGAFLKVRSGIEKIIHTNISLSDLKETVIGYKKKQDEKKAASVIAELVAPVDGKVLIPFGVQDATDGAFRYGVELSVSIGEQIRASGEGTVTEIAKSKAYGTYLVLSHEGGFSTLYGRLGEILPNIGEKVLGGQPIAAAAEESLLFELKQGETYLNPADFIAFKEEADD